MKYYEPISKSEPYREKYLSSLSDFLLEIPENYERKKDVHPLLKELGYPLCAVLRDQVHAEKILLSQEDGYSVYRFVFTILGTIRMSGLYFTHEDSDQLVLCQHGFLGTPELMSGLFEDRNTYNYTNITERLVKLGVDVFCPQVLIWDQEQRYTTRYDREALDEEFRKKGSTIIGTEIYCLKEILRYFSPFYEKVKMFGMSYGAYYSYFTALADSPASVYFAHSYILEGIHRREMLFSFTLDELVQAAVTEKKFFIAFGNHDPVCTREGGKKFIASLPHPERIHVFDGDHEIEKDDTMLRRFLAE